MESILVEENLSDIVEKSHENNEHNEKENNDFSINEGREIASSSTTENLSAIIESIKQPQSSKFQSIKTSLKEEVKEVPKKNIDPVPVKPKINFIELGLIPIKLNPLNRKEMESVTKLLNNNYISLNGIQFNYSSDYISWLLRQTDPNFIIGLNYHGKLVGFITAFVQTVFIGKAAGQIPIIGLWCIHRTLRGLGLGKWLRGVLLNQAVQFNCKQWMVIQNINEISMQGHNSFTNHLILTLPLNSYRVKGEEYLQTIKPIHYASALETVIKYLSKYQIRPIWSEEEFILRFASRKNVVYTFVMEDLEGNVTEFISFTVRLFKINNTELINVAQLDYYVHQRMSLTELITQGIMKLKRLGIDQVNIPQIMNCNEIEFKMKVIPMKVTWYYNSKINPIDFHEMALVPPF